MQQRAVTSDAATAGPAARSEQALEAIRNWIIDGTLAPGSALVEAQLAGRLGVSRVPVREALQRLSQQGLVELRPGQSAQVVRRSARDVVELLEIREQLAGLACTLAADRRTDEDLALLSGLIARGRELVTAENWVEVGIVNSTFHAEITRMSGNRQLEKLIENSRFQLAWLNRHMAQHKAEERWNDYEEIVNALRERDARRADEAYRRHLRWSKDTFVQGYLDGTITT